MSEWFSDFSFLYLHVVLQLAQQLFGRILALDQICVGFLLHQNEKRYFVLLLVYYRIGALEE